MAGYLIMASEAFEECPVTPTHIFLQAGIGGFPASVAAFARRYYGNEPKIIIVEPTEAPVIQASIAAGKAVEVKGEVSIMGRLDCKVPSLAALSSLASTANYCMTITDQESTDCLTELSIFVYPLFINSSICLRKCQFVDGKLKMTFFVNM